ncbi:PE domain-containing protein [Mycobacterium intermedium]
MAADTSSPAATRIDVVGFTAAALAAPSADPRLAKSVAAAAKTSGEAMTNDI